MPAAKDQNTEAIHAEIFQRLNALESKVDESNGYLRGVVESNEKLIKLFARALYILAFIAVLALGAVIFGAIGKEGLYSVRQVLPTNEAVPATNDLDKWRHSSAPHGGGKR